MSPRPQRLGDALRELELTDPVVGKARRRLDELVAEEANRASRRERAVREVGVRKTCRCGAVCRRDALKCWGCGEGFR